MCETQKDHPTLDRVERSSASGRDPGDRLRVSDPCPPDLEYGN
jgi:hypothetical protein